MVDKSIPYCPLMSAGNDIEVVCTLDRCAWYLKAYKMCSVHVLAHNAAMDIQAKRQQKSD